MTTLVPGFVNVRLFCVRTPQDMCACQKTCTLDELKATIREEITQINSAMLEKVETNFHEQLQNCINEIGHHIMNLAFQT